MAHSRLASAVGACTLVLAFSLAAAELSQTSLKEITQLLDRIEGSNCSFNRNGSWYEAADARKHLQRKLDYMVERKMLGTAEEFIAGAATSSSMSGKAYLIRCGGQEPMASATWLNAQLQRIRTSSSN